MQLTFTCFDNAFINIHHVDEILIDYTAIHVMAFMLIKFDLIGTTFQFILSRKKFDKINFKNESRIGRLVDWRK